MSILKIKNLSVSFNGKEVVKNVSFNIKKGEILALVGESGSGKTITALSIIKLLTNAAELKGEVYFKDNNILALKNKQLQNIRGRKIAFIFQDPNSSLNPVLTVGNQVNEVLKAHTKLNKKSRFDKVLELFKIVGLDDIKDLYTRYPHQLSGGQKQRIIIAQALAADVEILIADEPTTALDVSIQKQILELIFKLKNTKNLSVLLITHDLSIVKKMADEVVVLKQGVIVESNTAKDFFNNQHHHPYSKLLLEALPKTTRKEKTLGENVLNAKDVSVFFPIKKGLFKRTVGYTKACKNISFNLKENENLAIVGESGSGKTTLAKAIIRQLDIYNGKIIYKNNNISKVAKNKYAKDVQIIFQNVTTAFNPRMRIGESILEGMQALKLENSNMLNVKKLLKRVELDEDMIVRYPHQLSGGQLQRAAIARAIAVKPKVIICDEPTSALDVTIRKQILDLLLKMQNHSNISFIFITHDMSIVRYFADSVLVIKQGEIVDKGDINYIFNSSENSYTKELLSAILV